MPHDHNHDHDHDEGHGHHHDHAPKVSAQNERRIAFVFILTAGYALVQAVGGWVAGSLALISDAGHMISDAAALALALVAYRIARRPADPARSYGYARVRVLAALINGLSLLALVIWIIFEAIQRINSPSEVMAWPMLLIAFVGLFINILGAFILRDGHQSDGNLRGAYLHVIGDLLGSVGAIAAAIGIMVTGWMVLDPILSVFVALLVVRSAWGLVRASLGVLLQSTPDGIDLAQIETSLLSLEGIAEVGHLHIWALSDEDRVATLHVSPKEGVDPLTLPPLVSAWLRDNAKVSHATVQVDPLGALSGH